MHHLTGKKAAFKIQMSSCFPSWRTERNKSDSPTTLSPVLTPIFLMAAANNATSRLSSPNVTFTISSFFSAGCQKQNKNKWDTNTEKKERAREIFRQFDRLSHWDNLFFCWCNSIDILNSFWKKKAYQQTRNEDINGDELCGGTEDRQEQSCCLSK